VISDSLAEAERDEGEPELAALLLLVGQRFLELLRCDALLFEKQIAKSDGHLESGRPRAYGGCRQKVKRPPTPHPRSSSAPPMTTCDSTSIPGRIAALTPAVALRSSPPTWLNLPPPRIPSPLSEQPPFCAGGNHLPFAVPVV
jgi:hypothetical protein